MKSALTLRAQARKGLTSGGQVTVKRREEK